MRFIVRAILLLFITVLCATTTFAQSPQTEFIVGFTKAEIEDLIAQFESGTDSPVLISIPTKGGIKTASLKPNRDLLRERNARISGTASQRADTDSVYAFSGTLTDGAQGDGLAFTISRNHAGNFWLSGFLRRSGAYESISLLSESRLRAASLAESSSTELEVGVATVDQSLLQALTSKCAEAIIPPAKRFASQSATLTTQAAAGALRELQVATEADASYVSAFGTVASANSRIVGILNGVDLIFQADLGVKLSITYQHAWESAATAGYPYTSTNAETLLTQFASYWGGNISGQQYDVAHLFTGSDLNSTTVGLAYLGGACRPEYRYSLVQRIQSDTNGEYAVPLSAHELGHNLDADHDSGLPRSIMYPELQPGMTQFSQSSKNQMNAFLGSANSNCLTPLGPPVIVNHPQSRVASVGTNAYFLVDAGGSQPLRYQWRLNGKDIPGATNPSLSITADMTLNGAEIRCRVYNDNGEVVTNAAILTVTTVRISGPPSIDVQPTSQVAIKGSNVTFTAQASGPGTITYQWYRGRAKIKNATTPSITFLAKSSSGKSQYHLVAKNQWGETDSAHVDLLVGKPPVASAKPVTKSVVAGRSARISFGIKGSRPQTYQWYRNGAPLEGAIEKRLVITPTAGNNGDIFYIVVTNPWGTSTSANFTLNVRTN